LIFLDISQPCSLVIALLPFAIKLTILFCLVEDKLQRTSAISPSNLPRSLYCFLYLVRLIYLYQTLYLNIHLGRREAHSRFFCHNWVSQPLCAILWPCFCACQPGILFVYDNGWLLTGLCAASTSQSGLTRACST